jgi:hypothetical protein
MKIASCLLFAFVAVLAGSMPVHADEAVPEKQATTTDTDVLGPYLAIAGGMAFGDLGAAAAGSSPRLRLSDAWTLGGEAAWVLGSGDLDPLDYAVTSLVLAYRFG